MIMMLLDGVEGNGSRDARREYHINTFETSSFVDKATVRRHLTVSARWCLADDIPGVPQDDEQI
jgi:hypothetical protein